MFAPLKKSYDNTRQHIKKQRHPFANKGLYTQSYAFSNSRVWMWELDHKKAENQRIDAFKLRCWRRLECPFNCKEIKPVNPKGNQPWISIGMTDAEAEVLILWPPDKKSWVIGKDSDVGKDWGQEENGVIEDEMVGWHHELSRHEFEQGLRDSEGQGGLTAAVHGPQRVIHDLATEQHILYFLYSREDELTHLQNNVNSYSF